jgi:triosephosphate isomerase
LIAGNWKMYKTRDEAVALAGAIKKGMERGEAPADVLVCPNSPCLQAVGDELKGSPVNLGAQNMHFEEEGAYTGEVSGEMLLSVGCSHVLVGHSERRQLYGEDDQVVNKKVSRALAAGLLPVLCLGEVLEERDKGITEEVVDRQLSGGLAGVDKEQMTKITVAYEPVWAIGTGRTATPEQAQEVHAFLRAKLAGLYDQAIADSTRILYGGSVKPDNVTGLMECPDVDGGLVGGASLKAEDFLQLIYFDAK